MADESPASGRQANKLLQAMNMALVTLAIDADIPDPGAAGDEAWLLTPADGGSLVSDDLPEGP